MSGPYEIDTSDYGVDPRNPTNEFLQASIAISLKRIADALAGSDTNTGVRDALCFIDETLRGRG